MEYGSRGGWRGLVTAPYRYPSLLPLEPVRAGPAIPEIAGSRVGCYPRRMNVDRILNVVLLVVVIALIATVMLGTAFVLLVVTNALQAYARRHELAP